MKQVSELMCILNGFLDWNKARLACFANMLLALLAVKTVNLSEIACAFSSDAQQSSRYKRLCRFFRSFSLDFDVIAALIFTLFQFADTTYYLSMDRTNWQWGKKNINVLTLAIVYRGIAIPIYWTLLDKKGNSNTQERIVIMQKFIARFGKDNILGLLGDREFVGDAWFRWLIEQKIAFYIRVKKNTISTNSRGLAVDIDALFHDLKIGEQRALVGRRKIFSHQLYVAGLRLQEGKLLLIVTSEQPEDAIKIYALRWEIETLFACLKSRGFRFEETHITDKERIAKLVALLAIAFCWCHKIGEWRHEEKAPIQIKKHGRPAISLFRYGLDFIREAVIAGAHKAAQFVDCLNQLKPSKRPAIRLHGGLYA